MDHPLINSLPAFDIVPIISDPPVDVFDTVIMPVVDPPVLGVIVTV